VYEKVEELLDMETTGKDYMVIMGDWNAVLVGEGKEYKGGGTIEAKSW